MVFTTLHANDNITALGRLIDLGVPPFLVGSAVSAVLGQRLVRLLCPKCKIRYKAQSRSVCVKRTCPPTRSSTFTSAPTLDDEDQRERTTRGNLSRVRTAEAPVYYGRTGVFELLVITDPIRDLIRDNPNLNAIKAEAVKTGMKYLQEDGLRQVIEGKTSHSRIAARQQVALQR